MSDQVSSEEPRDNGNPDTVVTPAEAAPPPEPTNRCKYQHVRLIVNPVSGTNTERLEQIKQKIAEHPETKWELLETKKGGDARQWAHEAKDVGAQAVAAFGGDGTIMEVADGLRDTGVPMAILPGGTGNVMSIELGIPTDLAQAFELLCSADHVVQDVDMACVDNQNFMLRVGIGLEAEMSVGAERSEKAKWGRLAYGKALWTAIRRQLGQVRYKMTLDDTVVVRQGVSCMVCNSASIGLPNMRMVPNASATDGLLSVVLIHDVNLSQAAKVIISMIQGLLPMLRSKPSPVEHWTAKKVTIELNRAQTIAYDGEYMKKAKRVSAWILPQSVKFIVPPQSAQTLEEIAKINTEATDDNASTKTDNGQDKQAS